MAEELPQESITTKASAYVLTGSDGTVWVAPVPAVQPAGVMPHLAPGEPVEVLNRDPSGNLAIRIPPNAPSEFEQHLTAYVVSPDLAHELLDLPVVPESPEGGDGRYS
jgi:hypothetical protein